MATLRSLLTLDDTRDLALVLAAAVEDGDVLLLEGDIGAGKTTFVGQLAHALGSREPARSPTYTVAHEYELADGRRLAHLDLYRQAGALDEAALGDIEGYLDAHVVCIEWPAAIEPWLDAARPRWRVGFEPVRGERRVAVVRAPDAARAARFAGSVAARLIP